MARTHKTTMLVRIRSGVFYVMSVAALLPFLLFLPTLLLPPRIPMAIGALYLHLQLFLLKVICGIRYRVEGAENLPKDGYLIASQHESSWETLYFQVLLDQPVMFAKKEVFSYPLVGLLARKFGHIPVDRSGSADAMREGFRAGREAANSGRNLLIFPTGTRGAVKRSQIQSGIGVLYQLINKPVVPVLLNSGGCWPSGTLLKFPGTINVRILPAIPVGMDRRAFLDELSAMLTESV